MTNGKFITLLSLVLGLYSMQSTASICWNGIYAGVEAGPGWSRFNYTFDNPNYFNTLGPVLLGSDFNLNGNAALGGGYIGYLYQTDTNVVLGIEANILATAQDDQITSPFFSTDTYKTSLHTLANAKLRAGYAMRNWLWTVSGGYAAGKIRISMSESDTPVYASGTDWLNGWTAGLGVDYRIKQHVSLGLQYDYSQLNMYNKTISCNNCGTGVGLGAPIVHGSVTIQSLMARLSYYFG